MKRLNVLFVALSMIFFITDVSWSEEKKKIDASKPGSHQTTSVIYELKNEVAVCKVKCRSFGVYDCQNRNEREIVNLNVANVKRLLIKGRGLAEASTSYSDGRITAEFESNDGLVSERGEAIIKCKSSRNFKIDLPFKSNQSGELTLYLRVSDWCTSLTKLKVVAIQ